MRLTATYCGGKYFVFNLAKNMLKVLKLQETENHKKTCYLISGRSLLFYSNYSMIIEIDHFSTYRPYCEHFKLQ